MIGMHNRNKELKKEVVYSYVTINESYNTTSNAAVTKFISTEQIKEVKIIYIYVVYAQQKHLV